MLLVGVADGGYNQETASTRRRAAPCHTARSPTGVPAAEGNSQAAVLPLGGTVPAAAEALGA